MVAIALASVAMAQTWRADNANGTYTNPLFFDEFSDPDLIRVDSDFYLTGTTMHSMPGLPVLHSRDLVNWTFLSYAMERLDLGPSFRLEEGKSEYGRGIWAPCFRYHKWNVLHLQQRQSPDYAIVPCDQSKRAVDTNADEAFAARSVGSL